MARLNNSQNPTFCVLVFCGNLRGQRDQRDKGMFPSALQITIRSAELVGSKYFRCQVPLIAHRWQSSPTIKKRQLKCKCGSICLSYISIGPLQKSFSCLVASKPPSGLYVFLWYVIPQQEGIVRLPWVRGLLLSADRKPHQQQVRSRSYQPVRETVDLCSKTCNQCGRCCMATCAQITSNSRQNAADGGDNDIHKKKSA